MSGRGSGPWPVEDKSEKGEPWPGKPQETMQARPHGPAETSLPERPGPLGWLSHSRSTRQVIGWTAWLALGPQQLEEGRREEPRRCVRCAR
jgi:hypothetical protein